MDAFVGALASRILVMVSGDNVAHKLEDMTSMDASSQLKNVNE